LRRGLWLRIASLTASASLAKAAATAEEERRGVPPPPHQRGHRSVAARPVGKGGSGPTNAACAIVADLPKYRRGRCCRRRRPDRGIVWCAGTARPCCAERHGRGMAGSRGPSQVRRQRPRASTGGVVVPGWTRRVPGVGGDRGLAQGEGSALSAPRHHTRCVNVNVNTPEGQCDDMRRVLARRRPRRQQIRRSSPMVTTVCAWWTLPDGQGPALRASRCPWFLRHAWD
jgi:hypothetical protein